MEIKQPKQKTYLANSRTWKKYPIKISKKIAEEMKAHCKKQYHTTDLQFALSLFFLEIVMDIKKNNYDCIWEIKDFGCFLSNVRPKMIFVTNPPMYKQNCKRIRFSFDGKFKRRCYRVFNSDNPIVIKYLNVKKWNSVVLKRIALREKIKHSIRQGTFKEIS